jgi:WD40 repeat protein
LGTEPKPNLLECWDVERNARISLKQPDGAAPLAPDLLFASDDRRFLSVVDKSNSVHLFDLKSGQFLRSINLDRKLHTLGFEGQGKTILTGCGDKVGAAHHWDVAAGKAVGKALDHESAVKSLAIARSGRRLLTGCEDGTAHLWNAATGDRVGEPLLVRKRVSIKAVAFSSNDRWVAAAGWDGTLRVWEIASSKPVGGAIRCAPDILSVAFHPDPLQPMLLILSRDAIQLWTMPAPMTGSPQQIRSWLEAATGMEMDAIGLLKSLPSDVWEEAKAKR